MNNNKATTVMHIMHLLGKLRKTAWDSLNF